MSDNRVGALFTERSREDLAGLARRAVDIGLDFADGRSRDDRVLRYADTSALIKLFGEALPEHGISESSLLDELGEVARWSIAQHDPRYLAFPDVGSSVAGLLAGIVALFLNQNLIAFDRSAPAASVIETQVIQWLRELVGYSATPLTEYGGLHDIGGMWTSGGNMSNHIAIACALARTWPQIRTGGLTAIREHPTIVLARGVEHFSYAGAAQVLGLGTEALAWSAPASSFTTDVDAVAAALDRPPPDSRPFMVVGVAGNCRTTGIDDLAALAALCAERGVWFHVDACHGGSLLFSERLRHRLTGIERADSASLDPHKGLFVTYPSSYLLVRDSANLARFARYPDRLHDADCLDLGLVTPFYGSRGFESLRLWALVKHLGRRGIGDLVEQRQRTFDDMQSLIESSRQVVMVGTSDFYRCAFVYCPPEVRSRLDTLRHRLDFRPYLRTVVSRYTRLFCERLYRSGAVVFDLFALQDLGDVLGLGPNDKLDVMGMCVGHPAIADETKDEILAAVVAAGHELAEPMLEELAALGGCSGGSVAGDPVLGPAGW